jgi:hypothetical protein
MADPALSSEPMERYGAIERAYCEERWMTVINDGQQLLGELASAAEASPVGLKERLQLLIGHAYLYGLGDRDSAEDFYQAVLGSDAEPTLRQIAEQGLQQCVLPVAAPASAEAEEETQPSPSGAVSTAEAEAAVWLEGTAGNSPQDPVLSPQLEAALAPDRTDASRPGPRDGRADAVVPPVAGGQAGILGWLAHDAPAASPDAAPLPVMPWLESGPAPASAPGTPSAAPQAFSGQEDVSAQEDSPIAGSSAPPSEATVEPSPQRREDAMAFKPETAASLQATAAAVAAAFGQQESSSSLASLSEVAERLVPEVVDEPELIEVYQADGRSREELLLAVEAEAPGETGLVATDIAPARPSFVDRRGSEEPLSEAGLVATDIASAQPSFEDRRGSEEPPSDVASGREDRLVEQPPALDPIEPEATTPSPVIPTGVSLFSGPPQPVAEEDSELLMGLLRVEMG